LTRNQIDGLAEELAGLLKWDPGVLRAYAFLLSRSGQVKPEELPSGFETSPEEAKKLLFALEEDGLTVNGDSGIYPVHPRLGISNIYRLSTAKDPSVSTVRPRIDSLISILASFRDKVEDREYAAPRRDGPHPETKAPKD